MRGGYLQRVEGIGAPLLREQQPAPAAAPAADADTGPDPDADDAAGADIRTPIGRRGSEDDAVGTVAVVEGGATSAAGEG
jgi:hypothetical protein